MGELIFTFWFGGALIILGIITKVLLTKMERATNKSEVKNKKVV